MEMKSGTIVFIHQYKGYGYILPNGCSYEDKHDYVFFHANGLSDSEFEDIREGSSCRFTEIITEKGKRAIGVVVITTASQEGYWGGKIK